MIDKVDLEDPPSLLLQKNEKRLNENAFDLVTTVMSTCFFLFLSNN